MYTAGSEFLVNTVTADDQDFPTVTSLTGGNFVVSWADLSAQGDDGSFYAVKAQLFSATGVKLGEEFQVNTETFGSQLQPTVTGLSNGNFVVSWADGSGVGDEVGGFGIKAQLFSATGVKLGGEFPVNTSTAASQSEPAVTRLANGGFVVSWMDLSGEGGDSSGFGIKAQVFDAAGAAVGGEFLVNTQTFSYQFFPTITGLANGGFVVSWTDGSGLGADVGTDGIKAQVFDAAGIKVGDEFLVNTETLNGQFMPSIASLTNGGFVVSWTDTSGQGGFGSISSVKAQLFDATGAKLGGEFLVNTTTSIFAEQPTITGLTNGGFVVSWIDGSEQDGDASIFSIRAQVFDADGAKVDDEFLVNTETLDGLLSPTVTGLTNGGFVVSWMDASGDGSGYGIKARIYGGDAVNDAPVLASPIPDQASPEDAAWSFMVPVGTFADADSPTLALTATLGDGMALPDWLSFNGATGTFSGTPPLDFNGALDLKVSASDGNLSASGTFRLTVDAVNDAPTLGTAIADQLAIEDSVFFYAFPPATFIDVDAGDTLTYAATLLDGTPLPSWLSFDGATGTFSGTPLNADVGSLSVKVTATDTSGAFASSSFALSVANTNDAPVARADSIAVNEDATTGNLWNALLANDTDVDVGDVLSIVSVNATSALGSTIVFNSVTRTLTYSADADTLDLLPTGAVATDSFIYTLRDAFGATTTASVTVTVTGVADGITRSGTNRADALTGTTGEDTLRGDNGADTIQAGSGADLVYGENGDDILFGGAGIDQLFGGNGSDTLDGGQGNDLLTGGAGRDTFVFGSSSGADRILDFKRGEDRLSLVDGVTVANRSQSDVNGDGTADTLLTFNSGGSVALLGVTGLSDLDLFG